ncbi:helix-turn-helix domain-containing protein [Umezawaea sp. NPDC059074]|uniref:helix-turn-helix domain-containing protein n=1 Tax=Umezawaea sp. NPDC059074 TaxID=3346716 RepID=UPI0036C438CB
MLTGMVRNITPKAMALGAKIRSVRDSGGLSQRGAAKKLGIANSTMSRIESGESPPSPDELVGILEVLGATEAETEEILSLASDTGGNAWLAVTLPEQQAQLAALLDFEQMATHITSVAPLLMPGLLQSSGYARAVMRAAGVPDDEVETRVAVRMGRRDILVRTQPTVLLALVGEGVLRRPIGGPRVLAEQLDHLAKMAQLPNITVRVIPEDAGWHPALEGPFLLLGNSTTSLVHLENRRSALFLNDDDDIAAYVEAVDRTLKVAIDAEQTAALIAREAERIRRSA